MKVTFRGVDARVWKEAFIMAYTVGRSLQSVASELLNEALAKWLEEQKAKPQK